MKTGSRDCHYAVRILQIKEQQRRVRQQEASVRSAAGVNNSSDTKKHFIVPGSTPEARKTVGQRAAERSAAVSECISTTVQPHAESDRWL